MNFMKYIPATPFPFTMIVFFIARARYITDYLFLKGYQQSYSFVPASPATGVIFFIKLRSEQKMFTKVHLRRNT